MALALECEFGIVSESEVKVKVVAGLEGVEEERVWGLECEVVE